MAPREKYSDPQLRDEVKEEIHAGDKGGKPGQWSARKAQMMASEYKKRGDGYNTNKKEQDSSQKHLDQWTKEDWQTKEGSGTARKGDDSRKRYLPKKAWEQMSDKQKEETEEKKVKASKKGKQYVGNTKRAKEARKDASEGDQPRHNTRSSDGQSEKPVGSDHGLDTGDSAEELVKGDDQDQRDGQRLAGTKRRAKQSNASVKKQKDDLQKTAEEDGESDEEEYEEEQGEDEEDE
ncbi:uncharacterized protein N7498_004411 [Penicillium cinerascens]|uniref:DUF5872 domain-containing protein n=1 Tax=Penicillium cinerascens TaxID=70096 RepID=A0A9W9T8T7_9EURO|nr:uncharacterized protein N7498_004411 [Penicillium cinerascens]KAJ5212765.1 hypothetical protein N7498_004411 [Penicillium cinerascens]